MGLVKDTPFVISEAPFTSGGEWTKFYRRRQTTANGDDFDVARFVPIKSEQWRIRLARMLLFDVRSKVVEKTLRFRSSENAVWSKSAIRQIVYPVAARDATLSGPVQ